MGLFQKAVETYDAMEKIAGQEIEGRETLIPVGFISTKAQILIVLSENGDFIRAERIFEEKNDSKGKLLKKDKRIIIPATEKSAGRTVNASTEPHPLCDKLMFFCPDNKESYEAYIYQLSEWCNSKYTAAPIKAVFSYVKKGSIRNDLIALNNVNDDELVCFRIISTESSSHEEIWRNTTVTESYANYCKNNVESSAKKSLCYVSGELGSKAEQHLKGIFSLFGNAKLISANDDKNFTYRGRFIDDSEAVSVSYIASQKAHNALKWVISNDGVIFGDRVVVSWNPRGIATVKPTSSLFSKKYKDEEKPTPTNYRDILSRTVNGYKSSFTPDDQTITAIFEASSKGRLSISYYSELSAIDFIERLKYWDETCAWNHKYFGVAAPSIKSIVDSAYGTVRNDSKGKQTIETDSKVIAVITQRLLFSRLEQSPFPTDIMQSAIQKCSSLQIYDDENRYTQLFVTCAMIKKYRFDHFKEEWIMALEPEKKNRSYQFGRLLAVMEKAERDTYEAGEQRESNAIRMQSFFIKRPMYATKLIMEQLKNAYYPKLSAGAKIYYDKLIGEIMLMISNCPDFESTKPLGEEYLMGYYLQKNDLYSKKNNDNNDTEDK